MMGNCMQQFNVDYARLGPLVSPQQAEREDDADHTQQQNGVRARQHSESRQRFFLPLIGFRIVDDMDPRAPLLFNNLCALALDKTTLSIGTLRNTPGIHLSTGANQDAPQEPYPSSINDDGVPDVDHRQEKTAALSGDTMTEEDVAVKNPAASTCDPCRLSPELSGDQQLGPVTRLYQTAVSDTLPATHNGQRSSGNASTRQDWQTASTDKAGGRLQLDREHSPEGPSGNNDLDVIADANATLRMSMNAIKLDEESEYRIGPLQPRSHISVRSGRTGHLRGSKSRSIVANPECSPGSGQNSDNGDDVDDECDQRASYDPNAMDVDQAWMRASAEHSRRQLKKHPSSLPSTRRNLVLKLIINGVLPRSPNYRQFFERRAPR